MKLIVQQLIPEKGQSSWLQSSNGLDPDHYNHYCWTEKPAGGYWVGRAKSPAVAMADTNAAVCSILTPLPVLSDASAPVVAPAMLAFICDSNQQEDYNTRNNGIASLQLIALNEMRPTVPKLISTRQIFFRSIIEIVNSAN